MSYRNRFYSTLRWHACLKQISVVSIVIVEFFYLTGCAHTTTVKYNPRDFINPNRIVTKKVVERSPKPKIVASYGLGSDPAVLHAFDEFLKTGRAKHIKGNGIETVAYNRYQQPLLACTPLQVCVVELAKGEIINDITVGNKANWFVRQALVGPNKTKGSPIILIKPTNYHLATNLVITTTKRLYDIGLVSVKGAYTHLLTFYYPEATLQQTKMDEHHGQQHRLQDATVATSTAIAVNHLHFDYSVTGDHPVWTPTRIFDDGNKTFIQMPAIVERMDLPVLYIKRSGQLQLVNYRYRRPYFIIDGLFQTAYLISGKGEHQLRVVIHNNAFHVGT